MAIRIISGCEPQIIDGNNTGFLLLHGFTSSPFELRLLGEHLKKQGFTVHIPLLPGHGTSPRYLRKHVWYDWFEHAKQELFRIRKKCDQVYVAGLSMGGSLALHLAAHYEINGIIALAPGLILKNRLARFARLVSPLKWYTSKNTGPDIREKIRTMSYDRIPLRSISELLKLFRHLRDDLADIYAPTLIIYPQNDHVIDPKSAKYIYQNISSRDKRILELKESYHILTLDVEKEKVFNEITQFISSLEKHIPHRS